MEFRSFHTIETAEQVPLRLELAGLASRIFAFLIDFMLMGALMGVVMLTFSSPMFGGKMSGIGRTISPVLLFLLFFGFHLVQEWLLNGKTLGKVLLHIRVVRDNGQPLGFWEAFGRNLLRSVDVYFSGVGLLCMMFSPSEKRLGDYLAGTLVIDDSPVHRPVLEARAGEAPVVRLNLEEIELLSAFLARRNELLPEARKRLAEDLCALFSERLHAPVADETALQTLLASQRAESAASR